MKCDKCGTSLDDPLTICVRYPIIHKGKVIDLHLCRTHFYEADNLHYGQIHDWIQENDKDE